MVTMKDFAGLKPAWCPGCGNFGILRAVNKALVELNLKPHQVLMVSGIGQAGKLPHYSRANVFNSLHGRSLPVAIGAKLANPELTVIAIGGDGDGYGEGGNHFLHALRRNHDITYLVHDNQIYGLTKGQASPTSDQGFVTSTTPEGAISALNPVGVAITGGGSFVARAFAGDVDHLSAIIQQGIQHKGFSFIDILQPCVSFNHKNTFQWYRERVYKLQDEDGYDPTDKRQVRAKAEEWGERIPLGIIYREDRVAFEERQPALRKGPLVRQAVEPARARALVEEFR
ncbi:MAG: 2-oxoacid:ferredoxin oxidoreductase subunit beta [Dehalococcoidia bacterium]